MSGYKIPEIDDEDHIMYEDYLEFGIERLCECTNSPLCGCRDKHIDRLEKRRKKLERKYAATGRW